MSAAAQLPHVATVPITMAQLSDIYVRAEVLAADGWSAPAIADALRERLAIEHECLTLPETEAVVASAIRAATAPRLDPELDDDPLEIHKTADEPDSLPAPVRLVNLPPTAPLGFVVDRLLVKNEVNALVGDGGAGKSTVTLACAGAIGAGSLALGELVVTPGPVLIVSGEDTSEVIANRLGALARGHGWDAQQVLERVHVFDDGVDLDDPRWQAHLITAACDLRVVLAIFDPLVDLCGQGVEENSNTDAKRVTRYLRYFMRRTGATPVLSMHVSKPTEGRSDRKHRVRGASAWKNATRMCWWVEAQDGGMELEAIKCNRMARPQPLALKLTVTTEPDNPLMWRAAHLALDTSGDVVDQAVIRVLRWLLACRKPPTGREVAEGDHGVPRDRAKAALGIARTRGWAEYEDGPRKSHLWRVTQAGEARVMLEAPVSGSVR
jgi:AAA domain